jgi:hypothetical protein
MEGFDLPHLPVVFGWALFFELHRLLHSGLVNHPPSEISLPRTQ